MHCQPALSGVVPCSAHCQVAERALYFINNDKLFSNFEANAPTLVPILFPVLFRVSKYHWNNNVHSLVFQCLKLLSDISPPLFDDCTAKYKVCPTPHAAHPRPTCRKTKSASVSARSDGGSWSFWPRRTP